VKNRERSIYFSALFASKDPLHRGGKSSVVPGGRGEPEFREDFPERRVRVLETRGGG